MMKEGCPCAGTGAAAGTGPAGTATSVRRRSTPSWKSFTDSVQLSSGQASSTVPPSQS
jgi:hypothetical protein